jgi:two-component system, cell cycle sensor histidine kinase and response regulator CckA
MENEDAATYTESILEKGAMRTLAVLGAARWCARIILVIGVCGLVGWLADIRVLAQPVPSLAPMSFITAIVLTIAAMVLLLPSIGGERGAWLGFLPALAIMVVGAWSLYAYLFGGDLPFDVWMLRSGMAAGLSGQLNRMSPTSALCFFLFGLAACLQPFRRHGVGGLAQFVQTVGVLIALASLIGYLYSITALISISDYKPIAPQTVLALLLCFTGLFMGSPDQGIMRILLSDQIGGLMARRLLFFVLALPILLGGAAAAGERVGLFNAPMSLFYLTAATELSFAGLLLFNAFTINRSERGRRVVQKSLEESERAYRMLFEKAADPMFLVDRDLVILEANAAATTCLDRPAVELRGRRMAQISATCAAEIERRLQEVFEKRDCSFEACADHPGGKDVPMEIHARAIEFRGSPAVLIIARDLSERRRSERALAEKEGLLRQAQKMEAIGRLAGGVAHDFNNLLTVMMGYADLLLGKLPDGSDTRSDAFEIKMCAARAAALTRQLLTFSRRHAVSPRVTEVNAVIESMTPLLGRLIGEKIRLDIKLRARQSSITIDPNQLEQVVLNLAVNARDVMPDGGTLTIESRDARINGDTMPFTPSPASGLYVELVVQDTGPGIPPDVEPHIFEPFFTTKGESQGTGLGLSTVYGIVTQNNGAIGVQTSSRTGTAMRLIFPRVERELEASAGPRSPAEPARAGTLLLIEDESVVREYLSQGLRKAGYTVLESESGDAALRLLETYAGDVEVVLSDVVMEGTSGMRLGERIVQRLPGARVLFMSGYDASQDGEIGLLCGRFDLITKPFTVAELVKKLSEGRAVAAPAASR